MMKKIFVLTMLFALGHIVTATEYHVSVNGSDTNVGSITNPFKTINKAASMTKPGDTVTVHAGTYREWVNPTIGGVKNRVILYRASVGENVVIKGSETINNWKRQKNGLWKVTLPNTYFGDYNPYGVEMYGDWFHRLKKTHTLGEVYLNEKSLYEVDALDKLLDENPMNENDPFSDHKWYAEVGDEETTIWVNFQGKNPNKEQVEINVRQACFFPKENGVNYITVRGFRMMQAATQWAPPTAEQQGLIGPNWSKGWIIEQNIISNSKCVAISLGKERSTGQNKWSRLKMKHGTQVQREVVFNAIKNGWSKEAIGSHVVRDNIIFDCGQAGVVGHLGGVFSEIYENHIFDINAKDQFGGYEIAGVKLHAGIDALVSDNCIHNTKRGIWMDWQAQGSRLSGNLLFDNTVYDLHIEVNHGPHIIDHNICLSPIAVSNVSQGGLYVNNLFAGAMRINRVQDRYTPYHYEHSTMVAGLMTIQGGDDRFYQNIFIKSEKKVNKSSISYGMHHYDDFPSYNDLDWCTGKNLKDYANYTYPVDINKNAYFNGAKPFVRENEMLVDSIFLSDVIIEERADDFYLKIKIPSSIKNIKAFHLNTLQIDPVITSELPFEDTNGKPIVFDRDYFNELREDHSFIGPFNKIDSSIVIKVWPK